MSAELLSGIVLEPEERTRLNEALRRHFAHDSFLPVEAETIASVLRGHSTLAVMPTGAGRSLCYQLAALLLPATTVVLSPLIALMKDQLDGLPLEVATRPTEISHTLDGSELNLRLENLARGAYKLIYAAPERLRQRPFLHALARAGVSLLVVDEAHCVSLWGHDFRPDYLHITRAWHELGQPPVLAMPATATPRVRDDIGAALCSLRLVATDVDRPNLRFEAYSFPASATRLRACRPSAVSSREVASSTPGRARTAKASLPCSVGIESALSTTTPASAAATQRRTASWPVRPVSS